jgi:hypothetical protein
MTSSQEKTNWWKWLAYALVTGLIGMILGISLSLPGFHFSTKTPAFFADDNFRLMFRAGCWMFGAGAGPLMSESWDLRASNRLDMVYGGTGHTRRSRMISFSIMNIGMILAVAAIVAQKSAQHR